MYNSPILITLSILLVVIGIFDSYKYKLQTRKIRQYRTARSQSRMFVNISLANSIIRTVFCIYVAQYLLAVVSLIGAFFIAELFFTIYIFYPYRKRSQFGFKKPNIIIYMINSFLPNSARRRL